MSQDEHDRIALAAAELVQAAILADQYSAGEPYSPWTALAGQIRLIAAQLTAAPAHPPNRQRRVGEHVAVARSALSTVAPQSTAAVRTDLDDWLEDLDDLSQLIAALDEPAAPGDPS